MLLGRASQPGSGSLVFSKLQEQHPARRPRTISLDVKDKILYNCKSFLMIDRHTHTHKLDNFSMQCSSFAPTLGRCFTAVFFRQAAIKGDLSSRAYGELCKKATLVNLMDNADAICNATERRGQQDMLP